METKICRDCLVEKNINDYYFNHTKNTFFSRCKLCERQKIKIRNKLLKENFPEKYKARNSERYRRRIPYLKAYYAKNGNPVVSKEKRREHAVKYYAKHKDKNHVKKKSLHGIFISCKSNAKRINREFNITEQYLGELLKLQNNKCAQTGIELVFGFGSNVSIDRIDSSKDYLQGNIQLVTIWYNLTKQEESDEDMFKRCKEFVMYQCKKRLNKN